MLSKVASRTRLQRLRARCEKLAEKYWRGAQIEEFDALSPEYAIRIEQKVNR